MQDTPAPRKRDFFGRVFRPRTCEDCREAFTPQSSSQKRCLVCRERRNALPPIRVIPARACEDCGVMFTPQKSVSRRCVPCQTERNRLLRLESCRRKRAERRGEDVIVRYCADCGVALPRPIGRPAKRCPDCRLAELQQRDLNRREERARLPEEQKITTARQRRPVPVLAPKCCVDCGAELSSRLLTRCPDCKPEHLLRLRLASNARRNARHALKPPRESWPPTAGLALRDCTICSVRFQPYRRNQLECSPECRNADPQRMRTRSEDAKRFAAKPENRAAIKKRRQVRTLRFYGMTPELYAVMLAEQGGVCALCGALPDPEATPQHRKLHVDHDHETGRVRALLCVNCNLGLGRFRDDPDVLRRAADFVEHHRAATAAA